LKAATVYAARRNVAAFFIGADIFVGADIREIRRRGKFGRASVEMTP
jgi:hypothetical protein